MCGFVSYTLFVGYLYLLLLLLRCLLPILLAFCLARPVFTGFRVLPGDAPQSVVLVVDDSTHRAYLQKLLQEALAAAPPASVNATRSVEAFRQVELQQGDAGVRQLLLALMGRSGE